MGVVFSIYKRKPKQRYELGKHRRGYPEGMTPPNLMEQMEKLLRDYREARADDESAFQAYHTAMMKLRDPGWTAMWSIMDDPNYAVFKMSRWTRDELADKLYRGSSNIHTMEAAYRVADHLLAWAGDDDVTLNPEEPGELAELGWPTRGYRDTGSIWDALNG